METQSTSNITFDSLPSAVTTLRDEVAHIKTMIAKILDQELPEEDEILFVPDLAKMLRLAIPTVHSKNCRGELPEPLKNGKRLMWQKKDIIQWLQEGKK